MFSTQELERYTRNIALEGVGIEGQERLTQSKVLVIGAGGLGSPAALYLAAAGVGTIGIVDGDTVELSNLQRQIMHSTQSVGRTKADSALHSLHALNPHVHVVAYPERVSSENIAHIIADYDFILSCVDNLPTRFLVNDACVCARKPFCHAGVLRFEGQLMSYLPNKGPCYRCIFEDMPSEDEMQRCCSAGILGAVPGIMGSLQALEALKYVLGIGDNLVGRMLVFDGLAMSFRLVDFGTRNKECRACGEASGAKQGAESLMCATAQKDLAHKGAAQHPTQRLLS
jgi:molybdopterin/thiamine biosynthesis adenylyltransferase